MALKYIEVRGGVDIIRFSSLSAQDELTDDYFHIIPLFSICSLHLNEFQSDNMISY